MNLVARNTKEIIAQQGIKQKVVAEKAGYTARQFSNMLHGRKIIDWRDVLRICDALNVRPNDLYGITTPTDEKDV
ncbi:MAG: helix-turn-helix transcriptional regulator [Ruminococcus sp.]|nr:helix-turn-helix transcriptional regulator [Ruminococcus sp.]